MARPLEPAKPVLIYDGDCSFCRRCVEYAKSRTGNAVDYRPYQEAASDFARIPLERFREAVQYIDGEGRAASGSEAVFRALAFAPRWQWLLWLYVRIRLFAIISEACYRWVAQHRGGISRLLGI